MELTKVKEFFTKFFEAEQRVVEFSLDEKCHQAIVVTFTDGLPNSAHQIVCNQVKITVGGGASFYFPLEPAHRAVAGLDFVRKTINHAQDFSMNKTEKELLTKLQTENPEQFEVDINQMAGSLGLSAELVRSKLVA